MTEEGGSQLVATHLPVSHSRPRTTDWRPAVGVLVRPTDQSRASTSRSGWGRFQLFKFAKGGHNILLTDPPDSPASLLTPTLPTVSPHHTRGCLWSSRPRLWYTRHFECLFCKKDHQSRFQTFKRCTAALAMQMLNTSNGPRYGTHHCLNYL